MLARHPETDDGQRELDVVHQPRFLRPVVPEPHVVHEAQATWRTSVVFRPATTPIVRNDTEPRQARPAQRHRDRVRLRNRPPPDGLRGRAGSTVNETPIESGPAGTTPRETVAYHEGRTRSRPSAYTCHQGSHHRLARRMARLWRDRGHQVHAAVAGPTVLCWQSDLCSPGNRAPDAQPWIVVLLLSTIGATSHGLARNREKPVWGTDDESTVRRVAPRQDGRLICSASAVLTT